MNGPLGSLDVVVASARHQMAVFVASWRWSVLLGIIQPAVLLSVTVGRTHRTGEAEATSAVVGILLVGFWSFTVWASAGILQRDRADGTLAACLTGARDFRLVLIGRSLGASLVSGLLIIVTLACGLVVLRQPIAVASPLWTLAGLAALFVSGLVMGAALACVYLLSRSGPQISSALMYPVFLLSGLLTPLTWLPVPLRPLSGLISLHWAREFLVGASSGTPRPGALAMVLVLTAGYAIAGGYAYRRVGDRVRAKGTLDLV
ncbi:MULTISPECIES: ABC transporter permease [Streptomyces]|uniref:ABC transporter permease n=2 Tax=Streptomyces TaxID=1883 RepID=A0A101PR30_STRCK|nr:ABC transporter permease [Streptomyces corchorusii]AEY85872.1 putative ABC-transporter permease [Streptomyces hygroscopicus subsp. jinggangensis 5008]AGF60094.1 putative ABC-transporter permease [Streptomyces hygroscopicus subsp. jinggangensis TL01]ALO99424.1 Putative ABC-transporter permease [Streptomyces hygroscopicus subsp. limoneus]KUN16114.1 ABC transporter permease [Streptomyces corchorusii]